MVHSVETIKVQQTLKYEYFKYIIIIIFTLTFSNIKAEINNFEKGKNFFDKKNMI